MKLIIAGSRTINLSPLDLQKIREAHVPFAITEVVSGCARGVDRSGEVWAEAYGHAVKRFPADWTKHGKSAGFRRNTQMADYADALLAIWDGESRGTRHMIGLMGSRNKLHIVVCRERGKETVTTRPLIKEDNDMPNPQLTQPPSPAAEEIFSRAEIRQLATLYSERAETDTQIKDLEADKEKLNVSIRKILDKHDPAQVRSFRLGNFATSYYKTVRFNQKMFVAELLQRKVSSKVIKEAQEASNVESENFTLMVKALKNGDAGE